MATITAGGRPSVPGSPVAQPRFGGGWGNPNLPPDVKARADKVMAKFNQGGLINVGGRPGGPGPPAPPPTLEDPVPPLVGPPARLTPGRQDPRNEVMRILWGGGAPQIYSGGGGYTPGYNPTWSFPTFSQLLLGMGGR